MVYGLLTIAFTLYWLMLMTERPPTTPLKYLAVAATAMATIGWVCHFVAFEPGPPLPAVLKWLALVSLSIAALLTVVFADWSYSANAPKRRPPHNGI